MQSKSVLTSLQLQINTTTVKNACENFQFSSKYVKNMIQGALINILYQRLTFDKKEFLQKEYENVPFVIFKKGSKNRVVRKYYGWANAIVDAFEKHYLKDIHLFINPADSEDLQEHYKFTIKYNVLSETHVSRKDNPALKEDTVNVFKTLRALGDYPKLNLDAKLKMELTYYDGTPEDYHPPGFIYATVPICITLEENPTTKKPISLFKLDTGFHKLSCKVNNLRSKETELEIVTEDLSQIVEQNVNDNSMKNTEEESAPNNEETCFAEEEIIYLSDAEEPEAKNSKKDKRKRSKSPILISAKRKRHDSSKFTESDAISIPGYLNFSDMSISDITVDGDEYPTAVNDINCVCHIKESLEMLTVQCTICSSWVHLACQGQIRQNETMKNKFVCITCNNTDEMYKKLITDEEKINFARLRLLLAAAYKRKEVPALILEKTFNADVSHEKFQALGFEVLASGKLELKRSLISKSVKLFFKNV